MQVKKQQLELDMGTTDWFQIGKGVRQGCMLSPCLFNFCAEYIMRNTGLDPTLCDPMDCSLPGSSARGILQARVLEWVAISFSRRSSQPRGSNPGLPNCRQMLYHLSHQGRLFTSLVRFISRHFILFEVICKWDCFLNFSS